VKPGLTPELRVREAAELPELAIERFLRHIVECRKGPSHGDKGSLLVRLADPTPFLI
jgi:hypothetical protein